MCGIAGIVRWDGRARVRARDSIHVRRDGPPRPDDEGIYLGAGVGLGMRRLSIIDLDSGQQPMSNEDGTIWVVFNGEIYNYRELRQRSRATRPCVPHGERHRNHRAPVRGTRAAAASSTCAACSRSRSGTAARAQLLLARDRLGIKPLYYAEIDGGLDLRVGAQADPAAAARSSGRSNWEAVGHLLHVPGHAVGDAASSTASASSSRRASRPRAADRALRIERYWDVEFEPDETCHRRPSWSSSSARCSPSRSRCTGQRRAARRVPQRRHRLERRRRDDGAADVRTPVKTFSIGFDEAGFDELAHARRRGAAHSAPITTSWSLRPDVVAIVEDLDLVSRRAVRRHVGDSDLHGVEAGGRARQGGADRRRRRRAVRRLRHVPRRGRERDRATGCPRRCASWPAPWAPCDARRHARAGASCATWRSTAPRAISTRRRCSGPTSCGGCFTPDAYARSRRVTTPRGTRRRIARRHRRRLAVGDPVPRSPDAYLPLDILTKVDRMTMAHSIEARPPLLDHKLVEFAATVPARFRLRDGTTKYLFKQAMRGVLPDDIIDRPKQGFAVPLAQWFRRELAAFARDLLLSRQLPRARRVQPAARRAAAAAERARPRPRSAALDAPVVRAVVPAIPRSADATCAHERAGAVHADPSARRGHEVTSASTRRHRCGEPRHPGRPGRAGAQLWSSR